MQKWTWFMVCLLFIGLDQATKLWTLHCLDLYQSVAIFPGLHWTLVFNTGSAFGFLSHSGAWPQHLFTAFGLLMSLGLTFWIVKTPLKATRELLALTLILSGALGNVIDRIRLGYVVDFIDVYYKTHHWPVFNVADSAICVGAILLFFSTNNKNTD
ncbi:MAG: signal peptidase II [Legionella sp.]|nr:MAG: signal peptidase II [Legionella sp.]